RRLNYVNRQCPGVFAVSNEQEGYKTITGMSNLKSGEHKELQAAMSEFNIAVLSDYKEELSSFLKEQDLAAVSVDWSIIEHVDVYDVVIVNKGDGTKEQMEELVEKSDEHETSHIVLDTWGQDGSLELLEEALGYPTLDNQGYGEEAIMLHTEKSDHPMFDGFDSDEITILTEKSPYATFTDYEGSVLGGISVSDTEKGATIGFEPRSN